MAVLGGILVDAVLSRLGLGVFLCPMQGGVVDGAGNGNRVSDVLREIDAIALHFPGAAVFRGYLILVPILLQAARDGAGILVRFLLGLTGLRPSGGEQQGARKHGAGNMELHVTTGGQHIETTEEHISSLIDTWILLRDIEQSGERNRCLYVLKSRGMAHSNQLREFVISDRGIRLIPAYIGAGQVFTGSARLVQEAKDVTEALLRKQSIEHKQYELRAKRRELEARIENLRAEYAADRNKRRS